MSNTRYLQSDLKWRDTRLGTGSYTIGEAGCLLCSVAAGCTMLGHLETPATLNSKMIAINGFDGSLIRLGYVPVAVPGMEYLNYINCPDDAAPMKLINNYMDAGNVVIVKIDSDPDTVGVQDHWVILESRTEGEYIIIDPLPDAWTGNTAHLLSHYGNGRDASVIILAVAIFGSATPVTEAPSIAEELPLADGVVDTPVLMKRSGPGKEHKIVGRLTLGDSVSIADPENTVWVRLTDGSYVATKYNGETLIKVVQP